MRTATVHELKKELTALPPAQLTELCLRLARFKKENKELLTYLLLEAQHPDDYIASIKAYMDEAYENVNTSHTYLAKKTLRKILRIVNKHIRFTGSKQAETELLMYYCEKMLKTGIRLKDQTVLGNIYQQQIKKIERSIAAQHEDLQYDYLRQLDKLR